MPRRILLTTFLGLIVVVVAFATGRHLPLYDGLATPDEPYRYVNSQAGDSSTPPPKTTTKTYALADLSDTSIAVASDETGPQVLFATYAQVLKTAPNATKLILSAVPSAPNDVSGQHIVGNVYTVSVVSDAGKVTFVGDSSHPSYINLRLPQGYEPGAVMVYRSPSSSWKTLPTSQVGNDIYQAPFVGFGEYALRLSAAHTENHTRPTIFVAIGCLVVAFLLIIVFVRRLHAEPE